MRIILALTAAAACVILGLLAAQRLRQREEALRAWKVAFERLEAGAARGGMTLPELMRFASHPLLETGARLLTENPAATFARFWEALPPAPLLTSEETQAVYEGLSGLFLPAAALQRQAARQATEQMGRFYRAGREQRLRNERLYRNLGCLAGAAAFILLCG